jgi:hypothetical protein
VALQCGTARAAKTLPVAPPLPSHLQPLHQGQVLLLVLPEGGQDNVLVLIICKQATGSDFYILSWGSMVEQGRAWTGTMARHLHPPSAAGGAGPSAKCLSCSAWYKTLAPGACRAKPRRERANEAPPRPCPVQEGVSRANYQPLGDSAAAVHQEGHVG